MTELALAGMVFLPAAATAVLGVFLWLGWARDERVFSAVTAVVMVVSCAAAFAVSIHVLGGDAGLVVAHVGEWFSLGEYHFHWTLVADGLSLPFAILAIGLTGLIGAFSRRYIHREPGYLRFYFLLTLFAAGVVLVLLAGSLDLVFFGWEIVGVTSVLLIAFFHERREPVANGLRAFITYRFCDVGLLCAAVWMHHSVGNAHITTAAPAQLFTGFPVPPSSGDATFVGLLLLWAAMGKSAQVPLGGWLPRAMEGPTPSSAIFYGAISIHLGPYLLLRALPILQASQVAAWAVVFVGTVTAFHGTFVGRVQTDIKSALAYSSMTQVGLIFVEIGLGFAELAMVHIIGHAALRSLQILRSPSLIHDHHHLEQALGGPLPKTGAHLESLVPRSLQPWLYRHALERGYFDALLRDWVVGGFVRGVRALDRVDQAWTRWLAGAEKECNPPRRGGEP